MANRQTFTLNINAEAGQAKRAIEDLQRSINNLSKAQVNANYLDKGINDAVAAAKELEHHLSAALNQNTGKLNLNALTTSLEQSNTSAKDLMQTLLQGGAAGQQTFTAFANAVAQSDVPLKRVNKTLKDFATTLKNTVKWEISSTMVHSLESALSGAVSYAKNLNTSLTNIRIVTGQSVDDMARFAKEANVAAKALSTTTKAYADASLIYYQQGDNAEMAAKKAAITIKAANSSFNTTASEMSEYLTAVWNSYQVGADELERYVDIMANLGAKTATSLEEIATSMQKVAATSNTVGVSMEQVSSIIATVSSVTRESAESIGTSYKTIFARIGDLKLGKVDEDGVGLGQVSSQLDAIGVKILDESGNLREMGDIITDLGNKWQTMNQAQKTAVAQVVAGKRQYTQLMALFENWDMYNANMDIAQNSEGALQDMQDIYAESWEAASKRAQAAMENFYNLILNDQVIIKLTDGLTAITNAISSLVEGFGGLGGTLSHLGSIGTIVFRKQLSENINNTVSSIKTFSSQFKGKSGLETMGTLLSGKAKSAEQIKYEENTRGVVKGLDSIQTNKVTEQVVLSNARNLLTLKEELLNAESSLTEAQKTNAQTYLAELNNEQEALAEIVQTKKTMSDTDKKDREEAQKYLEQQQREISKRNLEAIGQKETDKAEEYAKAGVNVRFQEQMRKSKAPLFEGIGDFYQIDADKMTFSQGMSFYSTMATDAEVLRKVIDDIESGVSDAAASIALIDKGLSQDFDSDKKSGIVELLQEIADNADKAEENIKLLRRASNSLDSEVNVLEDALVDTAKSFSDEAGDSIQKTLNSTYSRAEIKANVLAEQAFHERQMQGSQQKFSDMIDPKELDTIGDKVERVAGSAMAMVAGFTGAQEAVKVLTADTIDLGQALSSAAGMGMSLVEGFMAGGGWGLLAAGIGVLGGLITGSLEQQEAERKERQAKLEAEVSSRVNNMKDEQSNLQSLLSNYNNLYSRYQDGEDVQNELAASATALADAYGITGASVAVATGNFAAFNDQIKETALLSEQLADAQSTELLARSSLMRNKLETKQQPLMVSPEGETIQAIDEYIVSSDMRRDILHKVGQDTPIFLSELLGNENFSISQSFMPNLIKQIVDDVNLNKSGWGYYDINDYIGMSWDQFLQSNIMKEQASLIGGFQMNDFLKTYAASTFTEMPEIENVAKVLGLNVSDEIPSVKIVREEDQHLISSDGTIYWDNNATADEKETRFTELEKWKEYLEGERTRINDPNSAAHAQINAVIDAIDQIVGDESLFEAINDYRDAKQTKVVLEQAQQIIKDTVGKTADDIDLNEYDSLFGQVAAEVDKNANAFKSLDGLVPGTEEFIQARNKIVGQIINDYTNLDKWTNVYLALGETFTNEHDFEEALGYVKGVDMKPEELTSNVLNAMVLDRAFYDGSWQLSDAALKSDRAQRASQEAQEALAKTKQVASLYKDDMEIADASLIYDTFFSEEAKVLGNYQLSWEEFLALDVDARATYFDKIQTVQIEKAKEAALAAEKAALEEQAKFEASALTQMYRTDTDAQLLKGSYYKDAEGNWQLREDADAEKVAAAQEAVGQRYEDGHWLDEETGLFDIDAFMTAVLGIETQDAEIKERVAKATADVKGFELLDKDGERQITKIERLGKIISELPTNMDEFGKLIKQLGNIDPMELINMSELERAELVLKNLIEPDKSKFTNSNGEFDAAGYNEAMVAYEEARQNAVNVIMESADAAFSMIENRMKAAKEEADKIMANAEVLMGAVETGELTEVQRAAMAPELLVDWDAAADGPARAAIAMRELNRAAVETNKANQELLATYKKASDNRVWNVTGIDITNLDDNVEGRDIFKDILANSNLDEEVRDVWLQAWDNATTKGISFEGKSIAEITDILREEISEMGNLTQEQMDAVLAAVRDNMATMFQELADRTVEEAQNAADAWLDAFNLINKAKLELLSGGSILEMLAGDPQAIITVAKNMGLTVQEVMRRAITGTLDPSQMKDFDMSEWVDKQMMAFGQFEGFGKSIDADMKALGYTFDKDKGYLDKQGEAVNYNEVLAPFYETMLKAINPNATQAQINNWLDLIFSSSEEYSKLLVDPMNELAAATGEAANGLRVLNERQQIDAATSIENTEANFAGKTQEYEDLVELQSAIDRAREAKYAEEDWNTLSAEDRVLLEANGINFNNVDTAAEQCAIALQACAQAALDLAKTTATDLGYEQNAEGEWGKYLTEEGYMSDAEGRDLYGSDWDHLKSQDGVFQVDQEINESMQTAEEAVQVATEKASPEERIRQQMELTAKTIDMTAPEFEKYIDYMVEMNKLQDVNEIMKQNNVTMEEARKIQMKYASQLKKMEKAYERAIDEGEDHIKVLNDSNSTMAEQAESVEVLKEIYGDVLGPMEDVSDEFLKSADNMELLQKAAKGDEEALNQLQVAYADALTPDVDFTPELEALAAEVAAWDPGDLEIGATIDDTDFLNKCTELINRAGYTADQASAALSSMGVDAEIKEHRQPVPPKTTEVVIQNGSYTWPDGNGGLTEIPLSATIQETDGGQEYVWYTIEGANYNGRGVTHGGGGSSHGGGSGGGGGSKPAKKETKKLIRSKDEIERYHKQNQTLNRVADELEKISKLKDRAYGKDHIAQIDAETAALQEQLAAQQALHDEAMKWMASDKADLMQYGAQFDEDGTITNYEQVMQNIIDEYNAEIERYNNSEQGEGDKLRLEAAQQKFEDAKQAIEDYEEAVGIANETANEMLEIQNQMSELEVEKITYELELKMDMNERDLELLEYYQDKYEDQLEHQDELFNTFLGSLAEYESNLAALGTAYDQLNEKFALGLINEADYAEAMAELQSEIVDNLSSIQDIQEELVDVYANTLSLAREEVEKTTDAIDHSNEAMQSFMNIMALSGMETDYKKIADFYNIMNENNLTKLQVQKAHLDALLKEEERFKNKVGEMTDLEKKQYAALQEEIQDTRDTLLQSTEEALETIRSTYENTINDISKNLDQFMAGAAGSMTYLQDQYGYFQEEQSRYVSTAKELYEVSKLNREIENTLGETTSKTAKEALKALQEKINKQSELNELTEYDIEMNQLQYQLLLARIKLEEAQNAKDTVRLTRDENGNYAYQYTANQNKIDEAAQHYEDILQQINDTTVERTAEIEQQLLNTMANYKEKFQEIATDYTLTEEERLMKLQELNNQFAKTMRYIQEQNGIATDNLTANQEAIASHYGQSLSSITESTAGNVNDTIQSMINKTQEYIEAMNKAIFGEEGAQSAWQQYLSQIGDVEGAAGTAYEDMLDDAQEMGEMNEFAAEEALEVIQTLTDTLEPLANLSAAWDAHNAILEATISDYEQLAVNIAEAIAVASEFGNTIGVGSADGTVLDAAALGMISTGEIAMEEVSKAGRQMLASIANDTFLSQEELTSAIEAYQQAYSAMMSGFNAINAGTLTMPEFVEQLEQSVSISADFPNVSDHNEIEEALTSLINRAAQFASRKK